MGCEKFREYFIELLESGGSLDLHPEVRSHLDKCSDCRSEYEELSKLFGILEKDRLRDSDDSRLDNIVIDINRRIDADRKIIRFNPRYVFSFVSAVAAAMLILFIGSTYRFPVDLNDGYFTGYPDEALLSRVLKYSGVESDLEGTLYSAYNDQAIEELELYWYENAGYIDLIDYLDKDELHSIRIQLKEELNDIS